MARRDYRLAPCSSFARNAEAAGAPLEAIADARWGQPGSDPCQFGRLVSSSVADKSVADQLRELGMKGVLVQMAERGQLLALKCEMPQCYHPKGRGAFDEVTTPRTKWAPSPDHYPILKSAGGKLRPENVRLSHTGATTGTMDGGNRSGRSLPKASPSPKSPSPCTARTSPRPTVRTDGRRPWYARPTCPRPGSARQLHSSKKSHGTSLSSTPAARPRREPEARSGVGLLRRESEPAAGQHWAPRVRCR